MMDSMNITFAKYRKNHELDENTMIVATINGESFGIPLDPANRHYAEILRQVEAGELTIEPADEII